MTVEDIASQSSVVFFCFAYQVQQVGGSADDTLVRSERLHYNSKVLKATASTWQYQRFWLDDFTARYWNLGKSL